MFRGHGLRIGRTLRMHIVRLAIFALVLNAWAPTVTSMLASATGRVVLLPAHCLAMAIEQAQADAHDVSQDSSKSSAPGHDKSASCPFCFAHAGSFALAASLPPAQAPAAPSPLSVAERGEPAQGELVWLDPKPRGPPYLS
jgi:hypothetical protein